MIKLLTIIKVFIVYGKNEQLKKDVSTYVAEIGYKPVLVETNENISDTIIESIEVLSKDVAYAIVILSEDDKVILNGQDNYKFRPRENVIFEFGYFISLLGRERVIVLNDIKGIFSDLNGVYYINKTNYKDELKKYLN